MKEPVKNVLYRFRKVQNINNSNAAIEIAPDRLRGVQPDVVSVFVVEKRVSTSAKGASSNEKPLPTFDFI